MLTVDLLAEFFETPLLRYPLYIGLGWWAGVGSGVGFPLGQAVRGRLRHTGKPRLGIAMGVFVAAFCVAANLAMVLFVLSNDTKTNLLHLALLLVLGITGFWASVTTLVPREQKSK